MNRRIFLGALALSPLGIMAALSKPPAPEPVKTRPKAPRERPVYAESFQFTVPVAGHYMVTTGYSSNVVFCKEGELIDIRPKIWRV